MPLALSCFVVAVRRGRGLRAAPILPEPMRRRDELFLSNRARIAANLSALLSTGLLVSGSGCGSGSVCLSWEKAIEFWCDGTGDEAAAAAVSGDRDICDTSDTLRIAPRKRCCDESLLPAAASFAACRAARCDASRLYRVLGSTVQPALGSHVWDSLLEYCAYNRLHNSTAFAAPRPLDSAE